MTAQRTGPFGARGGAVIALIGMVLFLITLWTAGQSMDQPPTTTAGATARGRGFAGYAALASYLEKRAFKVDTLQNDAMLNEPGLLVLTPPHQTDLAQMERMISMHRRHGPVLLILPKWKPSGVIQQVPKGKYKGSSVEQLDPTMPRWAGWHDELALDLYPLASEASTGKWNGLGKSGTLPEIEAVQSAQARSLVPLITDAESGRVLAGYLEDGAEYRALRDADQGYAPEPGDFATSPPYPMVLVFEPDLLNNYGFARAESSQLAEKLVRLLLGREDKRIIMDLVLNGYTQQQRQGPSLIKQAFKPPFLAATICLVLAAMVLFWRALHRFGPPLLAARAIAFGKRALVANAAGLIQRARRLHLLGGPYADAARERLSRTLALPARLDPAAAEQAIDRALLVRSPQSEPFSLVAARLRSARRPADLVAAARQLHALERTLMR